MGQHCCCMSNKTRHLPPIKPIYKSKLDTSHLKTSIAGTSSQNPIDPKKRNLELTKENADSIIPNGSLAMSMNELQNIEILHKNSNDEADLREKREKELNFEAVFMERKGRPLAREFDFQQDLNKAKVNVLEIYKLDEKGAWMEDVGMKELCKLGEELNKINYGSKIQKRDSLGKRENVEELAP